MPQGAGIQLDTVDMIRGMTDIGRIKLGICQ
jgi:hypothetical protein